MSKEGRLIPELENRLALQLLARNLDKQFKETQIVGAGNIPDDLQVAVMLYNHQTQYDTAALASISLEIKRSLLNIVRPNHTPLRRILQHANPISHFVYTPSDTPDNETREALNRQAFISLANKSGMLPKSVISLAPDGGKSPHGVDPQLVSTRGIQMIVDSFSQLGMSERIGFYPVGLNYNTDKQAALFRIGSPITTDVMGFCTMIQGVSDSQAIKKINTEFKEVIATSIRSVI